MADSYQIKIGGGVKPEVFASFSGLGNALNFTSERLSTLGATFATAFSLQRIGSFIAGSAKAADALADLREETGFAIETLGGLKLAADIKDLGDIDLPMKRFASAVREAQVEGTKFSELFKRMGVNPLQPLDKVLLDVADRFQGWEDGINKLGIAEELFGTKQTRFIQLLNLGGGALRDNISDFQKTHSAVEDAAKAVDAYNDSMSRLKSSAQGLGQSAAIKFGGFVSGTLDSIRMLINPSSAPNLPEVFKGVFSELANGKGGKTTAPNADDKSKEIAQQRKLIDLQIEKVQLEKESAFLSAGEDQDKRLIVIEAGLKEETRLLSEKRMLLADVKMSEEESLRSNLEDKRILLQIDRERNEELERQKMVLLKMEEMKKQQLEREKERHREQLFSFRDMFANMADAMAIFAGEGSAAFKAFATAQVIMSTALGAIGAYSQASAAFPPPAGQIIGGIAAGTVVALGAAQIAKINGAFFSGGYTGDSSPYAVAGVTHGREYVLNAPATATWGTELLDGINSGQITPGDMAAAGAGSQNQKIEIAFINSENDYRRFMERRGGIKIVYDALSKRTRRI